MQAEEVGRRVLVGVGGSMADIDRRRRIQGEWEVFVITGEGGLIGCMTRRCSDVIEEDKRGSVGVVVTKGRRGCQNERSNPAGEEVGCGTRFSCAKPFGFSFPHLFLLYIYA